MTGVQTCALPISGKPAPTDVVVPSKPEAGLVLCGSGLARDGVAAVYLTDLVACIAGKPAPTDVVVPSKSDAGLVLCGSGLARDGVAAVYLTAPCTFIAGSQRPQNQGICINRAGGT